MYGLAHMVPNIYSAQFQLQTIQFTSDVVSLVGGMPGGIYSQSDWSPRVLISYSVYVIGINVETRRPSCDMDESLALHFWSTVTLFESNINGTVVLYKFYFKVFVGLLYCIEADKILNTSVC